MLSRVVCYLKKCLLKNEVPLHIPLIKNGKKITCHSFKFKFSLYLNNIALSLLLTEKAPHTYTVTTWIKMTI